MSGTYQEKHAYLFIKGSHNSDYTQNGIIAIDAMTGGTSGVVNKYSAQFLSSTTDLDLNNFYIEYKDGNASTAAIANF